MPMEKEAYENLLNELNNPELEHTRRTEVLQHLRTDYTTVQLDFEGLTTASNRLQKDNADLVVSNSQLFRQLGTVGDSKLEGQTIQKEFSETVTIEQLEKTM